MGNQSLVDGRRKPTCELFLASFGEILRRCGRCASSCALT